MKLVKKVDVSGHLIQQEVYLLDNGQYVMVSTTDLSKAFSRSPEYTAIGLLGGMAGALLGEEPLPTSGEETMVFEAEADGSYSTDHDATVLRENGENSRERAMARLAEMEVDRSGARSHRGGGGDYQ